MNTKDIIQAVGTVVTMGLTAWGVISGKSNDDVYQPIRPNNQPQKIVVEFPEKTFHKSDSQQEFGFSHTNSNEANRDLHDKYLFQAMEYFEKTESNYGLLKKKIRLGNSKYKNSINEGFKYLEEAKKFYPEGLASKIYDEKILQYNFMFKKRNIKRYGRL